MAATRPLVSVIMAARDAEAFVGQALNSALAQSYAPLEVIVVDDGSIDATPEAVARIASADPRVRLVRTENRGPSAARNQAAALARGELLAPLDADDLWAPDKLERQVEAMQGAGGETGLVYCWTSAIDDGGKVLATVWRPRSETGNVRDLAIADGLIGNASVPLIRRSVFDRIGGYAEGLRLGEDWDFHMRAAAVTRFEVVRSPLVGYRLRAGGATSAGAWRAELAAATLRLREMWPDTGPALLRRRAYHIEVFLAFLAIRRGDLLAAAGLIARAGARLPERILSRETLDILALYASHLAGAPSYAWRRPTERSFL